MKAAVGRRVLMLLENCPYPQDNRVCREATTLAAAGYRVVVICPADPGQPWHERLDGVQVYRFPAPVAANGFLGYLLEYGHAMAATFVISLWVCWRQGFDVVHAHNPPDTYVLIAAFYKLFGKRFVYDHHDLAPEMYQARFKDGGKRPVYRTLIWLERLSCRLADHVIATNQSYKTMEMQRGRAPEARITIVRNGPDLDRLQPVAPDAALRETGKTVIGYVGVMGFQDGVDYLLRALRHLVHDLERTDFLCILIGKGDAWARLKDLAEQLDLDAYVWFTGYVSDADLLRYLCTADICVDPDPSNPFNDRSSMIKMTEYMALGKPIVAFDLPEHRVTAQDAAVYARPNDESDFAQHIAWLMDHPKRRESMGQKARERVETALAWPYQKQHLLDAYETLTAGLSEGQQVSPAD
ncbi:MAG: glycosyltransferase family 4 protein [Candidatus Tectomicrobia bacterium]|nr:glycosyltransferase family 4 protein [Candidatus Tectomicrobia bacterium]